jgi:hypothetical protein
MQEDLSLWVEDQYRLKELAFEALVSGQLTFVSPFTGTRKSVLDTLDLRRVGRSQVIEAGVLPHGPFSLMNGWSRDLLLEDLSVLGNDYGKNPFPSYFSLLEGDELEIFKVERLGSLKRVFKKKIKRK